MKDVRWVGKSLWMAGFLEQVRFWSGVGVMDGESGVRDEEG